MTGIVTDVLAALGAIVVGLALTPATRHAVWRLGGGEAAVAPAILIGGTVSAVLVGPVDPIDRLRLIAVVTAGTVIVAVDLARRRIPDAVLRPSYPILGASMIGQALVVGGGAGLVRSAIVALAFLAWHAVWCLVGAVGAGDVKLAGLLGLVVGWSGWGSVAVGAIATVAFAGVAAIVGAWRRRRRIAFGPVLLAGAAVGLIAG